MGLRSKSIAGRLTMMNILVSAGALLVCCAAFVSYDIYSYRDNLIRSLNVQAQIVGFNSISALTFNDPAAAQSSLSAFSASPTILAAGILTPDGKLFARYARKGVPIELPSVSSINSEQHWFKLHEVVLVRPIEFQDKIIGAVYLRSGLTTLYTRLYRYGLITLLVVLASLIAAFLLSSVFRRAIADPLISLAETAREVSIERDYSVRSTASADDRELDTLIRSFNEMLAEIQARDEALSAAHDELEQHVEERTSQLTNANRQLEQRTRDLVFANKELESFSYSVSHDLRSPLEVINGFSHVLETEWGSRLNQTGRECIAQIRTAAERMAELIEDMLNLSRVSTSAMHRDAVDLSAIAQNVAEDLHRRAPERDVQFAIKDNIKVEGDTRFLQIVMENLLRNAWKYTSHHEHARIEFGVEDRRGTRVYFVRDDGAGFDPKRLDRLFKPFQRLHSEAEFAGNGVGLATVQRILQRHGGQIWATGAVEKGATFYFTVGQIPVAEEPPKKYAAG